MNPRLKLGNIDELAESIKAQGIIQPLIVREADKGYEVIAGERRFKAAKKAGLKHVPCIVEELTDSEAIETSLTENLYRKDLNPMERGTGIKKLLKELPEQYPNQEAVAKKLGVTPARVSQWLEVLNYHKELATEIEEERLSEAHGRLLHHHLNRFNFDSTTYRKVLRKLITKVKEDKMSTNELKDCLRVDYELMKRTMEKATEKVEKRIAGEQGHDFQAKCPICGREYHIVCKGDTGNLLKHLLPELQA